MAPVYSMTVVRRARELHDAGWQLEQIADLLGRETGQRPDKSSVNRWVNPAAYSTNLAAAKRWNRRQSATGRKSGGRLGAPHHSPEFQEARCRALLAEAGVRATQAARVMDFDYPGQGWTTARARALTATGGTMAS